MAKKDIINDKTYIRVDKNMVGSLSYTYDGKSKFWARDVMYKNLEAREINEIMSTPVGYKKFEDGELIINEAHFREYFGLEELSEDVLTFEKIKEILKSGDRQLVDEKISTCTDSELEIFVNTIIEEEITDRNVIQVVEEYSGLEITEDVEHLVANKNGEESKDETAKNGRKARQKAKK